MSVWVSKKVIKGPFYPFSSPFLAYIKRFKLFFPLIFHVFHTRGVIKSPTRAQVSKVHLFHIKQASLPLLQGSVVAKADFSALRTNTTFVKTCEPPTPHWSMLIVLFSRFLKKVLSYTLLLFTKTSFLKIKWGFSTLPPPSPPISQCWKGTGDAGGPTLIPGGVGA